MSEVVFLAIAASAGAIKITAIMIGIVWALRSILNQHSAPLRYHYSSGELPYRSWIARSKQG